MNNARLEFLGDAILDSIVADILFQKFPGKREGFLTNTRSKIVQRETLNKLAVEIGLDKLIKFASRSSSHNSYMYGNAFEAFIGAIYLDRGYDCCKTFLEVRIITPFIDLEKLARKEVNFKSKLIEWSQKNKMEVSFELIEQFYDNENNPVFQTEIRVEGLSAGTGVGYSKKESQQHAAQMAIKKLKEVEFNEEISLAKSAKLKTKDGNNDFQEEIAETINADVDILDSTLEEAIEDANVDSFIQSTNDTATINKEEKKNQEESPETDTHSTPLNN